VKIMTEKYFYFIKALPLEEVYEQTLTFWQNNKGTIVEERLSPDNLVKTLKIRREMTLTSNGEDYVLDFSYNHGDSKTYIRIEVSLVQGYGIQWLTPKKIINKWISELKITPTYLVGRTNEEFFDFDKIPAAKPQKMEEFKPKMSLITDSYLLTSPQPKPAPRVDKNTISQPSVMIKPPESSTMTSKTVQKKESDGSDEFAMKFCTFCGTPGKKSFHFCENCGRRFE